MALLLHLTECALWEDSQKAGIHEQSTRGRTLDDEGFIHCSLRHQLLPVAQALYGDVPALDLVVLVIDSDLLDVPVRYEAAVPGDEEYPHIYGPVPLTAVIATEPWRWPSP